MSVPEEVLALLRERDRARAAKDYARADAVRAEIESKGFEVRDAPDGATAVPAARFVAEDPAAVESLLGEPASLGFSIHLRHEGYREDTLRFLDAIERHCSAHEYEVVLVDEATDDADWIEDRARERGRVVALHLDRVCGWAAARNAGLKRSRGAIVVVADLSVEPAGDVLAPLAQALRDPSVGIAGPFGVTSRNMQDFEEAAGPLCDAIEGYLFAVRRETLLDAMFHEKFKWYRNADIDFSFQVRSRGLDAVLVPCPVTRHEHRGWFRTDVAERARLSKRNFYTFYDRWKKRREMLLAPEESSHDPVPRSGSGRDQLP